MMKSIGIVSALLATGYVALAGVPAFRGVPGGPGSREGATETPTLPPPALVGAEIAARPAPLAHAPQIDGLIGALLPTQVPQVDPLVAVENARTRIAQAAAGVAAGSPIDDALQQAKQALADAAAALKSGNRAAAKGALQKAILALGQAVQITQDPVAKAALEDALAQLRPALKNLPGQACCLEYKPGPCPPVDTCTRVDACVILKIPTIEYSQPGLTHDGTYALANIFHAATARGVENVMVRVGNAVKACPNCIPEDPEAPCDLEKQ